MKPMLDQFPDIRLELGRDLIVARSYCEEVGGLSEPAGEALIGTGVPYWLLELNGREAATIPFLLNEPRPETVIRVMRWLAGTRAWPGSMDG